jgi:hypothetical protein
MDQKIGENGSICVLYEHKGTKKEGSDAQQPEAWRPTTSNSASSTATVVVSNASGTHIFQTIGPFVSFYVASLPPSYLNMFTREIEMVEDEDSKSINRIRHNNTVDNSANGIVIE